VWNLGSQLGPYATRPTSERLRGEQRAEVLVEVGDPNDEVGEVLAAVATHKVMICELLDDE